MELLSLRGNCGPISVWMMLRHHGKRVGASRIIRATKHTERTGCFTIGLALALHEFGLRVSFHTDPDPDVQPLERRCYEWARQCGILIEPAIALDELRNFVRRQPAIVYLAASHGGHFSPLVGILRKRAVLPYYDQDELPVAEFERRWSGPGYPRQSIFVRA